MIALTVPENLVGQPFGEEQLKLIRDEIDRAEALTRAEIARRICGILGWVNALGRPRLMTARVALLRLHRRGLIRLPPPRNGNGNGASLSRQKIQWPDERPVTLSAAELRNLRLVRVQTREQSALWNGLIARYHYLGYRPTAGAQVRYLIEWEGGVLGAIGFGAAAWRLAPRDRFIGWVNDEQRRTHLHLVINNTRFLILPWVRSPNLGSKVLGMCTRVVPGDFLQQYGYKPVLMETFVESDRFAGCCYRAANWIFIGQTQGRGRMDREHQHGLPIKDIWLCPLVGNFREALGVRGQSE